MARAPIELPRTTRIKTERDAEKAIEKLKRRIEYLKEYKVETIPVDGYAGVSDNLSNLVQETLSQSFGEDSTEFHRFKSATFFNFSYHYDKSHRDWLDDFRKGISSSIFVLSGAVEALQERISDGDLHREQKTTQQDRPTSNKVFVVHGRDDGMKQTVARFVERLGLEAIILHEQPNGGATVIEKFERSSDVGFAVVLMSVDDHGGIVGGPVQGRARQNVILELGYFLGRLGRRCVMILRQGEVEVPSDFAGVVYQVFDEPGSWRVQLAKELQVAGYAIDWNKVMS